MPKLLGIVGVLVICAGLDLLWQSRRELRFWFSTYLKIFGAMLRFEEPQGFFPAKEIARRRQSAVRFLLGMGFTFVLGPMLVVLGVTLMFFARF
jgi:hypothetical protein